MRLIISLFFICLSLSTSAFSVPCPFDKTKICALTRDILNDTANGLKFYAPTNYDHRISGEINIYDAKLVTPYQDSSNLPGQLKLTGQLTNGLWRTGEILTRINLDKPPYNAPTKSNPWSTKANKHGYLEVTVKMPKCDTSADGLCQRNINPATYNQGLWPAIWMMPTMDANWPVNGEIDIAEAYQINNCFNQAPATLHFNGNDSRCTGGDCRGPGFQLGFVTYPLSLYRHFHRWGFEWQPDPSSTTGGILLTGYFDDVKVWGPTRTDTLPADGPNALKRGFNDANGGYYLIVNLAIGGPFTGPPHSQLRSASMYIQKIQAFEVQDAIPTTCQPPANIRSTVSADKRQITLRWDEPENSAVVSNFQVNDWLNRILWKGANKDQREYIDITLPGTPGTFIYFLYSNCATAQSKGVQFNVVIP